MKAMLRQIVNSFVGAVVNALLTILVTKVVDYLYNKYMKKPFCVLCGGSGWRTKNKEKVRCNCNPKKESWLDIFKWDIS